MLLPSLAQRHLSGGPNTAISLAYHLAAAGVPVRFLSTDAAPDSDPSLFPGHVRALTGIDTDGLEVQVVDASDRRRPTAIGENDTRSPVPSLAATP